MFLKVDELLDNSKILKYSDSLGKNNDYLENILKDECLNLPEMLEIKTHV
jgi:hypothetical protein